LSRLEESRESQNSIVVDVEGELLLVENGLFVLVTDAGAAEVS
jgi:hypothetical protein